MTSIYTAILIAFFITLLSIPLFTQLATKIGLLDIPDQRKQHAGAIPLTGGVAVFTGTGTASLIALPFSHDLFIYLLCAGLILALGVIDDLKNLPAHIRLWFQASIALIMSLGSDNYIESLGNLLGFGEVQLGLFGYMITIVAVIGAINAFNMLDGIDGLSGSVALTSFAGLALLLSSSSSNMILSLILIAALIPYLAVNLGLFCKQKIFLGDAGSMLIGFTVVWLLIQGSQPIANEQNSFRPVTALWLIAIPLMDMAAIMIRRIKKGLSPFAADRDHIHHRLMQIGFSAKQTLLIIISASSLFIGIGITSERMNLPEYSMLMAFLAIFVLYNKVLDSLPKRKTINLT